MNETGSSQRRQALPPDELDALNKHGVFFKERVLDALGRIPGIGIVDEEVGVSFGGTRVIDIVAASQTSKPHVFLVIECKRVHAKTWLSRFAEPTA